MSLRAVVPILFGMVGLVFWVVFSQPRMAFVLVMAAVTAGVLLRGRGEAEDR